MKPRKRNCVLGTLFPRTMSQVPCLQEHLASAARAKCPVSLLRGIWLVAVVCVAAGCAVSPAGQNPADVGSETYEESAAVKLPETDGEAEEPLEAGLQEPETDGEAEEPSAEESQEPKTGKEAEEPSTAGSQEPDNVDEPAPPSEEEIAALGIREDMLAYWMVLNSKKPFVSTDEGGQKFYWNEWFCYLGEVNTRYHAVGFMIVDMDGDGREEVVLDCSPEATQVLHYEEGEVYSYQFVFRGMMSIRENGFYIGSDGAADNQFYRLTELNKDGYTEEMLAKMENGYYNEGYYEIGGKEVTEEEFWDYWESLESVERAEEMEFTESMLDRQLLGSLSEQELALVKWIPAENMLEKEPDYQEHKQALQLYAAVLSGEEEEIYVTVDACPWIDEPVRVYFSLVDMDRDGVYELVFTCEDHIIQILHYEEGKVYCYQLRPYIYPLYRTVRITTDGVFRKDLSPIEYARIASFKTDGCQVEPVEDYDISSHDWIRYYFYSEETIARWLK